MSLSSERIKQVTSVSEMNLLADGITSIRGFPEESRPAFTNLLLDVYSKDNISMLAVSKRIGGIPRPTLDIFLVWSDSLDQISDSEKDQILALGDKYHQFSSALHQAPFDSTIHVVNPNRFPTLEALRVYCGSYGEGQSSRVIACVGLTRQ